MASSISSSLNYIKNCTAVHQKPLKNVYIIKNKVWASTGVNLLYRENSDTSKNENKMRQR